MKSSKINSVSWQRWLLWSAGGVNLLILLLVFSIWRMGDRALNFASSLFSISAIESKVESRPLIAKIRNIQELATTVQTIDTIVPASAERKLGDISLATTKLLYLARGEIRAGVDLGELSDSDIIINQNQIAIALPPAKILDSKIDVNHSRVYDYDRGFLNLGPDVAPELQTLAQRQTLADIVATACREEILERANLKAKAAVTQILNAAGYKRVRVTTTPATCDTQ